MRRLFLIAMITVLAALAMMPAASAAGAENEAIRFKGKVRWVESLGTYALIADDGKKYHPVKQLPRAYQKDDLAVVVEGRLRPDLVGSRMYGAAVEVMNIYRADKYVSPEEKEAVRLLLARMDAFNERDLVKLRAIDTMALSLSRQQFEEWLAGWGNFTLHYVEASNVFVPKPAAGATIEGICLYSRERTNSMALSGNRQQAVIKFAMAKKDGKWVFTSVEAYRPDPITDMEQLVADLLARAKERYGTTDLAKWKGQST